MVSSPFNKPQPGSSPTIGSTGGLVRAGYLRRKRFEHLGQLLHWPTREGGEVAGETLPVPRTINRVTYLHDTMLFDLADMLVARTSGEFVPERRLRAELKAEGQRILNRLLTFDDVSSARVKHA